MAGSRTVRVTGVGRTKATLRRMGKVAANKALPAALFQEAEVEIIGRAKGNHYIPVDMGHLRASGHVEKPKVRSGTVEVVCGFGGPAGKGNVGGDTNDEAVGYALVQHERMDYKHTVGGPKYLERAAFEAMVQLDDRVARSLERAIEREGV